MFLVCLSEHFESSIILAQRAVYKSEMERRNIVLLRFCPQLSQDRPGFLLLPRHRIGISERCERSPIVMRKLGCLLKFNDSFTIAPLLPIGGTKYKVCIERVGADLEGLQTLLDRLAVPPRQIISHCEVSANPRRKRVILQSVFHLRDSFIVAAERC